MVIDYRADDGSDVSRRIRIKNIGIYRNGDLYLTAYCYDTFTLCDLECERIKSVIAMNADNKMAEESLQQILQLRQPSSSRAKTLPTMPVAKTMPYMEKPKDKTQDRPTIH
jgi:predicted DNA-binding transcriptional regulator YafY